MTEDKQPNPIFESSPESKALVKKLFEGMTPEQKASLMADLRERGEEIKKMSDPAFQEWLAENHRRNVSEINRQTMAERTIEQDNTVTKSILTGGLREVLSGIAEEAEKQEALEMAEQIGRDNMH